MKRATLCLCLICAGSSACSDDGETTTACLPGDVFTAVEEHVLDLTATADRLAGRVSATEVAGFLLAPGLPAPPAIPAERRSLVTPCAQASIGAPRCESAVCSQSMCTGAGAGWIQHSWLEQPTEADGWSFESVDVYVEWDEGEASSSFGIIELATSPSGHDTSMLAAGTMGSDGRLEVAAVLPILHPAAPTVLEYRHGTSGARGRLSIGEVVVAKASRTTGRLRPTGDCPSQ